MDGSKEKSNLEKIMQKETGPTGFCVLGLIENRVALWIENLPEPLDEAPVSWEENFGDGKPQRLPQLKIGHAPL